MICNIYIVYIIYNDNNKTTWKSACNDDAEQIKLFAGIVFSFTFIKNHILFFELLLLLHSIFLLLL